MNIVAKIKNASLYPLAKSNVSGRSLAACAIPGFKKQ